MNRRDFESHKQTAASSQLRLLAQEIAKYGCQDAKSVCFYSAKPDAPLNFLANGNCETYRLIHSTPVDEEDIASFKFEIPKRSLNRCLSHGFADQSTVSSWGLSALFDPLVDGFMSVQIDATGNIPSDCTVVALSDYGAIRGGIKVLPYFGPDWGESELSRFLNGNMLDSTTRNLITALDASWMPATPLSIRRLAQKKVLVWNFMPFLRFGKLSRGAHGLPTIDGGWILQCWLWLVKFIDIVQASRLIICTNKNYMLDVPCSGALLGPGGWNKPSQKPFPKCLPANFPIYSLSHPCTFTKASMTSLNAILQSPATSAWSLTDFELFEVRKCRNVWGIFVGANRRHISRGWQGELKAVHGDVMRPECP